MILEKSWAFGLFFVFGGNLGGFGILGFSDFRALFESVGL
ncbi:Uncharacterised protein [Helicobacter mustelae]|nr:Uncharacterised protein [Helicobacter mustelae]